MQNYSKVAVVIPSYNESANIKKVTLSILSILPKASIFIVDDNSPDGTAKIAQRLALKNTQIKVVVRSGKGGRGTAVLTGLKRALKNKKFTHFIEMDADLSHDPRELPELIGQAQDFVMAVGSRYTTGSRIVDWPLSRRIFSKLANFYARKILGISLYDCTNGYRAYTRKTLDSIDFSRLCEKGYALLLEMAYLFKLKGFNFIEMPSIFVDRKRGRSNTSIKEVWDACAAVVRIYFRHRA